MYLSTPRSETDPGWKSFSTSTTLNDENGAIPSHPLVPSPQAWLASSKRRSAPCLLDPPGSPLELVLPITHVLDKGQWNKRLSLLSHRYLGEYGACREDEIQDKAWKTLELFCASQQAKDSLQSFKTAMRDCTITPPSSTPNNSLGTCPSCLTFPSFLDDSFNSSHHNFSTAYESNLYSMNSMMDNHSTRSRAGALASLEGRGRVQSPLSDIHPNQSDMAERAQPRYMTPTTASRAQASTPDIPIPDSDQTTGKGKGRAWMLSAAKRVGIGSSTPRSKKEGRFHRLKSPKKSDISSPIGLSYASLGQGSYISTPSGLSREAPMTETVINSSVAANNRVTSAEKPLPSLPVATVQSDDPIARLSLLDAGDKPLQRSVSPSAGKFNKPMTVDWPTLSPSRPGTPTGPSNNGKGLPKLAVSNKAQPSPITSIGIFDHADDSFENMSMISNHSIQMHSPGESDVPLLKKDKDVKDTQVRRPTLTSSDRFTLPGAFANNHSQESFYSPDVPKAGGFHGFDVFDEFGANHNTGAANHHSDKKGILKSRIPKRPSTRASDGLAPLKDDRSLASKLPKFTIPRRAVSAQSSADNLGSVVKPALSGKRGSLPRAPCMTRIPIASSPLHVDRESDAQVTKIPRGTLSRIQPRQRSSWSSSESEKERLFEAQLLNRQAEEAFKKSKAPVSGSSDKSSPLVLPSFSPAFRVPSPGPFSKGFRSTDKENKHCKQTQLHAEPQRPRNEHIDRVKRLSVAAPEYGPVLRVSDSADRLIMGSPGSVDESPTNQRVNVKDFRRPAKPAGNAMNRHSLGPMSPTDIKNKRDSRSSKAASYHESFSQLAVFPTDPFVSSGSPKADKIPRVASDWPLRRTGAKEPNKTLSKVDYSEEKKAGPAPPTMMLGGPKTNGGRTVSIQNRPQSSGKGSQTDRRVSPASTTAIKSPHAIGERQQYPTRVSSRNAPVISTRGEFEAIRGRNIPTRFESVRPKHKPIVTSPQVSPVQNGNGNAVTPPKPAVVQTAAKTHSTGGGKKIFSNFRDLFHKKSGPEDSSATSASAAVKLAPAPRGSGKITISAPVQANSRVIRNGSVRSSVQAQQQKSQKQQKQKQRASMASPELIRRPADAFPAPVKKHIVDAELCAVFPDDSIDRGRPDMHAVIKLSNRILEVARTEENAVKQERLMTMAIMLVDTVGSAREAEKCMEEAKQAEARAEKHAMIAKKAVVDLVMLVGKDMED